MTIETTQFSHIQEALAKIYGDHPLAWAEYEDLLKAANAHKAFWRPIEEFHEEPEEQGKGYLIRLVDGSITAAMRQYQLKYWYDSHNQYPDNIITHFAEIPPLPKDEVKP